MTALLKHRFFVCNFEYLLISHGASPLLNGTRFMDKTPSPRKTDLFVLIVSQNRPNITLFENSLSRQNTVDHVLKYDIL
ncbi:MAG TPA: hypothetical protein DDX99_04550 [Desulfofustis sp.]|nr:hypothetical protein [Desulfofustis sp. PB-SRB1]HBH28100.1 hypothetical protein [Desulfofustis sp.]